MTKISEKVQNIFKSALKREDAMITYNNGSWTIFFAADDSAAVANLYKTFEGKLLSWNSEVIEDDGLETYITLKLDNTKISA